MYGAYFCCKRALHGTYGVQMWHLFINDISMKKMDLVTHQLQRTCNFISIRFFVDTSFHNE